MPVIVMRVKEAQAHPNADALRVYQFEAPFKNDVQVVANLENVYEVNDLVYVALDGSILEDGTKIETTKVRGIQSVGMALGVVRGKLDAQPGDNFTSHFCDEEAENKPRLIKWPEIGNLSNMLRGLNEIRENVEDYKLPKVKYMAKVKLNGTNSAIQVHPNGNVYAQSRTTLITPEKDNGGFARWVENNKSYWKTMAQGRDESVTLFGEWCGSGVQKGAAICNIDKKIFAIFAIQIGSSLLQTEPVVISDWIWPHFERPDNKSISYTDRDDVFVLPWFEDREFEMDFSNRDSLKPVVDEINTLVEQVEKCDPWVKDIFNVEGTGEGLVFYPHIVNGKDNESRDQYSDLFFKAKGEKHKVVKQKKAVQIDPEVAKSIDEFVNMFVTEARLEQGVTAACDGEYDMRKMGGFLKWFAGDVQKESAAELEASKLTWKQVNKAVMNAAKIWYQEQANKI